MLTLDGLAGSAGIAVGKLLILDSGVKVPTKRAVSDAEAETKRAFDAIEMAKEQLAALFEKTLSEAGAEAAAIFDIHGMMLEDDDYLDAIRDIIGGESLCAEYAVFAAGEQLAEMLAATNDAYMMERGTDVRDISRRVVNILCGHGENTLTSVDGPVVVAAEELLPSATVQMDKSRVLAFVSKKGSLNSHASILARTLGIPAVLDLGEGYGCLESGEYVIVDGGAGRVICAPTDEVVAEYESKQQAIAEEKRRLRKLTGAPAVTLDGARVELAGNIGRPDEAEAALAQDAEAIGLFRSEFLYFERDDFPTEDEQFEAYKKALSVMNPRRVVIRTLDLGADKQAPYFNIPDEENPAMGYRAIRISLDRREIFMPQLRALLRASVFGKLAIMFPMITGPEEIDAIFEALYTAKSELDAEGKSYAKDIELGAMIETPAAVMLADKLAEKLDFFSIGTNDLTQYTFAADRMNSKVSHLFSSGGLAILRMIRHVANEAHRGGLWVGICGESAADLSLLPYYIGMGIDELSMSAPSILKVKDKVRTLNKKDCEALCAGL